MNFIHHNYLGDIELNKKETQGIRLYNLPDGQWVPSITSVTSFYNREIFAKWRKRVGIEEAYFKTNLFQQITVFIMQFNHHNYLGDIELNKKETQELTSMKRLKHI